MNLRLPTALLFFVVLALLFFQSLVRHPDQVLYSDTTDLLAFHMPNKQFLVHAWQATGELPLWCPYSYGGSPCLHSIELGPLYPLHWPLYLLPPQWMGAALSWLVVVHVIVAGFAMYAYGRDQGLVPFAALVAALGYMFAGKWLLHLLVLGHYMNMPLAWLPLVLLGLERAIRGDGSSRASALFSATGAGVAYALIVLGAHPQPTLYAGLFTALWTLGAVRDAVAAQRQPGGDFPWRALALALGRWAGFGAWVVLIAIGLSAPQLFLTLDATPEATRAVGVQTGEIGAAALPTLLGLFGVGPSPQRVEMRGGLAVVWAAVACTAPLLHRGRFDVRLLVCVLLVLYGLGGSAFVQDLPGFRLFQLPGRALFLLAVPVALLAGHATQALFTPLPMELRNRCTRVLIGVGCLAVALSAGMEWLEYRAWKGTQGGASGMSEWLARFPAQAWTYWAVLPFTLIGAAWLIRRAPPDDGDRHRVPLRAWAWLLLLVVDAWALTGPFVTVRSDAELFVPSSCVREVKARAQQRIEQQHDRSRVLDRGLPGEPTSAPLGVVLPMLPAVELESMTGVISLDVYRQKEFLQLITDVDTPIRPRESMFGFNLVYVFPIENKSLLDLAGVRYLIQPSDPALVPDAAGETARHRSWRKICDDAQPVVYSHLGGGRRTLPPHSVYENPDAFPRAFVVPEARPLPERTEVLSALKSTDLRRIVFLENWQPQPDATPAGTFRPALIRDYRPNRVVVDVPDGPAGYLVLTDVYYPGWTCQVDGRSVPMYRADFLFRGVELPAGSHEVVFAMRPASYELGQIICGITLGAVLAVCLWWMVRPHPSAKLAAH